MRKYMALFILSLFFLPVTGNAQDAPPAAEVAVMPFKGDDETLSAEFQNAIVGEMPKLPVSYTPLPLSAAELPEGLDLPSDEPPDPSYLAGSRYVLTGEHYLDDEEVRHFQMWLWETASGKLLYTDELVAEAREEVEDYLPALVSWIFSQIPEAAAETEAAETAEVIEEPLAAASLPPPADTKIAEQDNPLNRWLYVGFRAGFSLGSYSITGGSDYNSMSQDFTYQATFLAALRVLPWLSLQAEAVYTLDTLTLRSSKLTSAGYLRYTDRIRSQSLMLPVLIKFPIEYDFLLLSLYGGGYYILPLGNMTWETNNPQGAEGSYSYSVSPPLGLTGGVEVGFRLGPGLIFFDLRYSTDLGITSVEGGGLEYTRSRLTLSLGYQFTFGNKKTENEE